MQLMCPVGFGWAPVNDFRKVAMLLYGKKQLQKNLQMISFSMFSSIITSMQTDRQELQTSPELAETQHVSPNSTFWAARNASFEECPLRQII